MNKILSSALFAVALSVSVAAYAEEKKDAEVVAAAEMPAPMEEGAKPADDAAKAH